MPAAVKCLRWQEAAAQIGPCGLFSVWGDKNAGKRPRAAQRAACGAQRAKKRPHGMPE